MIYPCRDCKHKKYCKQKKECSKRQEYLVYRKKSIERNKIWAKESTMVSLQKKQGFVHNKDKID